MMLSGKKQTSERIVLKSLKSLQKSISKNPISLVKQSVVNSTPVFKINKQSKKRGKKKTVKEIPIFMRNDYIRIISSLKFLVSSPKKKKEYYNFYKQLSKEILFSSSFKSNSSSISKKADIQKQVLAQKRYLFNFRWKG